MYHKINDKHACTSYPYTCGYACERRYSYEEWLLILTVRANYLGTYLYLSWHKNALDLRQSVSDVVKDEDVPVQFHPLSP